MNRGESGGIASTSTVFTVGMGVASIFIGTVLATQRDDSKWVRDKLDAHAHRLSTLETRQQILWEERQEQRQRQRDRRPDE